MFVPDLKTLRGEPYKREKLVNVPALFAMVLVLSLTLVLLFPRKAVFSDPAFTGHPDALSIAYLTLLLKSNPENAELRMTLTKQLRMTGQTTLALRTLGPLIPHPPSRLAYQVAMERLGLVAQRYFSQKGKVRKKLLKDLTVSFQDVTHRSKNLVELKKVYALSKKWTNPEEQLHIIEKMIPMTPSLRQKVRWMIEASGMRLAQNRPDLAAKWLSQAYEESSKYKKNPKLAYRLLTTLLATGKPANALRKAPYYLARHPKSRNLLDLAISISKQAGRMDLAEKWLVRATELAPTDIHYNQALMLLEIARGELKKAAKLADKRLQLSPVSLAERTRISRLYDWTGQPIKALRQWHWIIMNVPRPSFEAQKRGLKLALGMDRYKESQQLYERVSSIRRLTVAEQKELIGLYILQGETDKAEKSYQRFLKVHSDNRKMWEALAGLQVFLQKLPEAANTYEEIDRRFGLTTAEVLNLNTLYRLQNEQEKALTMLNNHSNPDIKHQAAYWKARMDLIWFVEDLKGMPGVYHYVMTRKPSQFVPKSMIEQLMSIYAATKEYSKAIDMALVGWQRFHQSTFAVNAVSYAVWMKNWAQASRIAATIASEFASKKTTLKNDTQYWVLLANVARELKQWKQAQTYLQIALSLQPANIEIRVSLLWLLISLHKEGDSTLQIALQESEKVYGSRPELWDVLAAGWSLLGKYHFAVFWYEKALAKHQNDWAWLLDYASVLRQTGRQNTAWRVRRYTLYKMDQMTLKQVGIQTGRDWSANYLRLVREFRGRDLGWKEAKKRAAYDLTVLGRHPIIKRQWLSLFTEWSMADGNESLSYALEQQADYHHINLPDWQRLGLALQRHESNKIESLLRSGRPLPLADRTLALAQNGYYAEALDFGLSHLSSYITPSDQQQLRAVTVSIRARQPNGISLGFTSERLGDISLAGLMFRYAHSSDDSVTLLDIKQGSVQGSNSLITNWPIEKRVMLSHTWLRRQSTQRVTLAVDKRVTGAKLQLGFLQNLTIFGGLGIEFGAGWHQRSKISAAAYELANWDHLDGAVDYQWDSRTRFRSQMRWNQFDSLWGNKLGKGFSVSGSVSHTIFANAPEWHVRSSIEWMKLSRAAALPAPVASYFASADPGISSILTGKFGRVGLGSTWQHGNPGVIAHRAPSPHWIASVDMGYQWVNKVVDWGVTGGIGWRVLGDDELALTASYSSDNQGAGSSSTINLSYNKYFGR